MASSNNTATTTVHYHPVTNSEYQELRGWLPKWAWKDSEGKVIPDATRNEVGLYLHELWHLHSIRKRNDAGEVAMPNGWREVSLFLHNFTPSSP